MQKTFLIFSTFALLLLVGVLPCVSVAEEEPPKSNLSIFQKKTLEYALLEYSMLVSRREQGMMSESLRSQLVFALERLVEVYCMPELSNTLDYVGPATGEECLERLEELEMYHPENPVALCARHGIDSDSCVDAYQSQFIRRHFATNKKEGIDDSQDYLVKLNAPSEAEMQQYKNYALLQNKFKRDPTPENKSIFEKALSVQIRYECNPTRYRLTLAEPDAKFKANYTKEKDEGDALKDLVDLYANPEENKQRGRVLSLHSLKPGEKKTATRKGSAGTADYAGLTNQKEAEEQVKLSKAWRFRLIPSGCDTILKRALEYDLQFPQAVCYREGFMSPACIRSLRAQRQRLSKINKDKKKEATAVEPKETSGFSSF